MHVITVDHVSLCLERMLYCIVQYSSFRLTSCDTPPPPGSLPISSKARQISGPSQPSSYRRPRRFHIPLNIVWHHLSKPSSSSFSSDSPRSHFYRSQPHHFYCRWSPCCLNWPPLLNFLEARYFCSSFWWVGSLYGRRSLADSNLNRLQRRLKQSILSQLKPHPLNQNLPSCPSWCSSSLCSSSLPLVSHSPARHRFPSLLHTYPSIAPNLIMNPNQQTLVCFNSFLPWLLWWAFSCQPLR